MTARSHLLSVLLSFVSPVALAALPDPTGLSDAEFAYYHDLKGMGAKRAFSFELRHSAPETKALWIERVQRYRAQHRKFSEPPFDLVMLAAGDPETWRRYAAQFSMSDDVPPLEVQAAADPALVAMVGDDLLKDNKNRNPGGDVILFGRASHTWELIRVILRVAPEFSDPVKKWARAVPESWWGEEEDVGIFREWWLANRDAMRAGRYAEVQPGRTLPEWLDGLPELDPPFEPGKPTRPIMFGNNDPILIKMQYAEYLEAKRTGKPYPPIQPVAPPGRAGDAGGAGSRPGMWVITILVIVSAVSILWLVRRRWRSEH